MEHVKSFRLRAAGVMLVALVAVALGATAANGASSHSPADRSSAISTAPKRGGTLTVETDQTWSTLDPAAATTSTGEEPILAQIFGSLFELGPNNAIEPDLALSYSVANHGHTFVIQLRRGVTFQDGTAFNAPAVVYNINRDKLPANGCLCQAWLSPVVSVKAAGDYKVIFTLSQPDAALPTLLADSEVGAIGSPTAIKQDGANYASDPVGAGPFRIVSNTPSATLTLVKWSGYWNKPEPYLSAIHFIYNADSTSSLDSVLTDNAQLLMDTPVDPIVLHQATADRQRVNVVDLPAQWWSYLEINAASGPFANRNARLALAYATNWKAINRALAYDEYPPTQVLDAPGQTPVIPQTLPGFPAYDLQKAKQLVRQLGGLSFTVMPWTNTPFWIEVTEALQKEWTDAGMTVQVAVYAHTEVNALVNSGQYDLEVTNYGINPVDTIPLTLITSCNGAIKGFCDPKVTNLLERIAQTYGQANAAHLMEEAMTEIVDRYVGLIPLSTEPNALIAAKTVQNLPSGAGTYLEGVWLK